MGEWLGFNTDHMMELAQRFSTASNEMEATMLVLSEELELLAVPPEVIGNNFETLLGQWRDNIAKATEATTSIAVNLNGAAELHRDTSADWA